MLQLTDERTYLLRGIIYYRRNTAGNRGARFSETGYSTLVQRAETDGDLAARVWAMPEIPRQHILKLFSEASAAVRS